MNGLVAASLCLGIGESNAAVDLLERGSTGRSFPTAATSSATRRCTSRSCAT